MSAEELAALVCASLQDAGITVTLTGGACVAIWSDGRYVSRDLDFIEEGPVLRSKVKAVPGALGFVEKNRYFIHPETEFLVEFPTGPLMVGDERVERTATRETSTGKLRLLTPTDCVKDRLAWYFHGNDRQALEQAIAVASTSATDLDDVQRWATAQGAADRFLTFSRRLEKVRRD